MFTAEWTKGDCESVLSTIEIPPRRQSSIVILDHDPCMSINAARASMLQSIDMLRYRMLKHPDRRHYLITVSLRISRRPLTASLTAPYGSHFRSTPAHASRLHDGRENWRPLARSFHGGLTRGVTYASTGAGADSASVTVAGASLSAASD